MDENELSEKILKIAKGFQIQAKIIEQKFNSIAARFGSENLLAPHRLTLNNLPETESRLSALFEAGTILVKDYQEYSINFLKGVYELADQQNESTRLKIIVPFIEKISFDSNQFKLSMVAYNKHLENAGKLFTFLKKNSQGYQIEGPGISFFDDELENDFDNIMNNIKNSFYYLGEIEKHSAQDVKNALKDLGESYI